MSQLLGSDFRLIAGESDDYWPFTALEAVADEFLGRTLDEQRAAIQCAIGLLMRKRFNAEVTATGRNVSEREADDIANELREHFVRVVHGGGANDAARRAHDAGMRAWAGDLS